jgi:peroxiredoxin
MRRTKFLIAAIAICLSAAPVISQDASTIRALSATGRSEHPLMPIGTAAPGFSLKGTDDKVHTLAEFSNAKVLVVMFESIHCPVSENYEGRIQQLYDAYHNEGVAFVAINPNNPAAVRLDELGYTDLTDSPEDMKIRVRERNIPWPYLYDGATQETVQKFGAVATPHVFIFDADRRLRYEGRIDDNQNQAVVKAHDARDAIEALLAGKPVAVPHTPAFGCSTKWLSKAADVQREWTKIVAEPVSITKASTVDLNSLRANAGDNVTVIHFWSLKDNSLDQDFTQLETTYRMYRGRSFKFVTVNADAAADADKVTEFLKSQHASSTNLEIAPEDLEAVQTAFESSWKQNEEFTAVIAPGGKLVYSHEGPVNVLDLRHSVLAHLTDVPYFPGQAQYWAELAPR